MILTSVVMASEDEEELSDGGKEQTAVGRVRKWVSTDPVRNKKKNQLEFLRK